MSYEGETSGAIRQRRAGSNQTASTRERIGKKVQAFDIYNKVHDDYNVKTRTGGALSVVLSFSLTELSDYESFR